MYRLELVKIVLLFRILAAHLLAECIFSGKRKTTSAILLYAIVSGLMAYVFAGKPNIIWLPLVIAATNVILIFIKKHLNDTIKSYAAIQLSHFVIILICWIIIAHISLAEIYEITKTSLLNPQFWILAVAYLLITGPVGYFIGLFTRKWRIEINENTTKSLENAGLWIGRFERIIILTFILIKQYSAIGFLIAAKSIFRFGEINQPHNRKITEYFLIGTLVSIAISLLIGILTIQLLAYIQ